jgi:hypothetical protein
MPEAKGNAITVRAANLLTALPNDDDLERTFRGSRRAHLEARLDKYRLGLRLRLGLGLGLGLGELTYRRNSKHFVKF